MATRLVDLLRDAADGLKYARKMTPANASSSLADSLRRQYFLLDEAIDALAQDEANSSVARRPKTVAVTACIKEITSYALLAACAADKSPALQVLMVKKLAEQWLKLHASINQTRSFVENIGSFEVEPLEAHQIVRELMKNVDLGDWSTQLKVLAFIAKAEEQDATFIMDPNVKAMKIKCLEVASPEIKAKISRLPEWYVTECDFKYIRVVGERSTALLATHVPTSQRSFVTWKDPHGVSGATHSSLQLWYDLQHPSICRLVGANSLVHPRCCIFTEYCSLGSIRNFLQANNSDRFQSAMPLLIQTCRALLAMHSADILHANLRSSSVLVSFDKQAKLTGLTKCVRWNPLPLDLLLAGDEPRHPLPFQSGYRPRCMAPECIASSATASPASDVFAFGVIMYEALTDKFPFESMENEDVWEAKQRGENGFSQQALLLLDPRVQALIQACCHRKAGHRPKIQVVLVRLLAIARATGVHVPVTRTAKPRKKSKQPPSLSHVASNVKGVDPPVESQHQKRQQPIRLTKTRQTRRSEAAWALRKQCFSVMILVVAFAVVVQWAASRPKFVEPTPTPAPTPSAQPWTPPPEILPTVSTIVNITASTSALTGIAVSPTGDIYVSDTSQVFRISPGSTSATLYAGSAFLGGSDGYGSSARFTMIMGLAVDSQNNVYVAEAGNRHIRKISPSGLVSTVAGGGSSTSSSAPATSVNIGRPYAVFVDRNDDVHIVDNENSRMLKLRTAAAKVTFSASLSSPVSITVDDYGDVYVANKNSIDQIDVGSKTAYPLRHRFESISAINMKHYNVLYVVERDSHCIREVDVPGNTNTPLAGSCDARGSEDGSLLSARFNSPTDIAVDTEGVIYVADGGSASPRVRKIVRGNTH